MRTAPACGRFCQAAASTGFPRQEEDEDGEAASRETAPRAWRENNPLPTTQLIGLDDAGEEFTVLYADARGVHRVYRMTFGDGQWRMWRAAPGFHQRFTGTLREDGAAIDARWERSVDGADWVLDFRLAYRR